MTRRHTAPNHLGNDAGLFHEDAGRARTVALLATLAELTLPRAVASTTRDRPPTQASKGPPRL